MHGPRSAATRAAILDAAKAHFAVHGYKGATIRAIAADARIDPSMVMRYYGNKADLFTAAVDVDLRLPDFTKVPRSRLGERLVAHFLERWEGESGGDLLVLLPRAVAVDDVAAETMRTIFKRQLVPAISPVIDREIEAPRRAGLIATQMLGLALCRHVLRLPPVAELDHDELVRLIGPTIQRYLRGL
ncbi:TetR family transcriptional regulator [Herbihabitans rhizosphaerae]|uniref:TetR family transcriptional regulator n=1 Tax=Herbihabitans rhizosphaerae TaxID=1872711 RepID=A0A4Q7KR24_9PSEU|nr:TetR family transcriptional regulator [Herbihabitans rhizosphaerae]RZS38856.1 TetR family transcriptional regulator [Herbihabitans rhizosphaerae]